MSFLFIWSTLSCLFDSIAAYLVQLVLAWCFFESKNDKAIRITLTALKREMNNISMVDEFSRYAKLRRKFCRLEEEAKGNFRRLCASRMKMKFTLTSCLRILNGISMSILMLLYRNEPVVVFSKGALWPVEAWLSFPANVDTCISLPVWILMMRLSVTCFTGR